MFDREELIGLIEKIKEGNYSSEMEMDADIEKLAENVIDPSAIDYVFQKEYDYLSVEDIVEKILEYKLIRL